MGPRIKGRGLAVIIAAAMILSAPTSLAATSKPTPKPTPKVTTKVTPKKTVVKVTPKKTVAKKRVVRKKKVVRVSPSPAPSWPPKGYRANGVVFAKIPTSKELLGVLSAAKALTSQVKNCSKVACGAVQVASAIGCTWWEITSTVSGPTSDSDLTMKPYGNLRTTAKATKPKQIVTILLISTEPLKPLVTVGGINISCYHSPATGRIPSNNYVAISPTPIVTPTPSPTPEPTS